MPRRCHADDAVSETCKDSQKCAKSSRMKLNFPDIDVRDVLLVGVLISKFRFAD